MVIKKYKKWAEREYNTKQRILPLILGAPFFAVLIPLSEVLVSTYVDQLFNVPQFSYGLLNWITGSLLVVPGLIFAFWAVYVQFTYARGSPYPGMATQKLIIKKPYVYCRNPMYLGNIIVFFGVALWIGSFSAVLYALLLSTVGLAYFKMIEEKELATRFGPEYVKYKQRTPFVIPHFWRREKRIK